MTKSLIIGAGSIGIRHMEILEELGHEIAIVSNRTDISTLTFLQINKALEIFKPDYIIISNETYKHIETIIKIFDCGFQNKVLVEKPISQDLKKISSLKYPTDMVFVGYNLRFHPCIQFIKELLYSETILSANIYVGQFLPHWRPNRDYKKSYSSDHRKGGGVLLELSHELDYLLYLFGKCKKSISLVSKLSDLDINCDDTAVGIFEFEKCKQISFNLNLIDKNGRREIILNTNKNTYKLDLYNNKIFVNNEIKGFCFNKNESYKNMHLDILNNDGIDSCNFKESLETLKLIDKLKNQYNLSKLQND
ncbi:Gfo/Idh/MocA family oxidoreductase [bacterium]|nr:Gfo/Idh/MocA family oxidoreductase [bacterium]